MSYGIYADWITTKAKRGSNLFALTNLTVVGAQPAATATNSKIGGYSLRAEISPIHKVMLGAGIGQVKTTTNGAAPNTKHTYTQVAATYEIYQNMEFNVHYLVDRFRDTTIPTNSNTNKEIFAEVLALF